MWAKTRRTQATQGGRWSATVGWGGLWWAQVGPGGRLSGNARFLNNLKQTPSGLFGFATLETVLAQKGLDRRLFF